MPKLYSIITLGPCKDKTEILLQYLDILMQNSEGHYSSCGIDTTLFSTSVAGVKISYENSLPQPLTTAPNY